MTPAMDAISHLSKNREDRQAFRAEQILHRTSKPRMRRDSHLGMRPPNRCPPAAPGTNNRPTIMAAVDGDRENCKKKGEEYNYKYKPFKLM